MTDRLVDCPHFATTLATDCECFQDKLLQLAVDLAFLEQVGFFEENSHEMVENAVSGKKELPLSREKHHNSESTSNWDQFEDDPHLGNAGALPAPRMPYGRPLTPPASMLAPALRGAGNESDTQFGSPASDAGGGSRSVPADSAGNDHRRHVRRRGSQSTAPGSQIPGGRRPGHPGDRPGPDRPPTDRPADPARHRQFPAPPRDS